MIFTFLLCHYQVPAGEYRLSALAGTQESVPGVIFSPPYADVAVKSPIFNVEFSEVHAYSFVPLQLLRCIMYITWSFIVIDCYHMQARESNLLGEPVKIDIRMQQPCGEGLTAHIMGCWMFRLSCSSKLAMILNVCCAPYNTWFSFSSLIFYSDSIIFLIEIY